MFFKNFKKKKEAKQHVVNMQRWEEDRKLYDVEKKRINKLLDTIVEEISLVYAKRIINDEFPIKVGDSAILNKYIDTPFGNWAGDANTLLYHDEAVPDMVKPYIVKITSIYADFSLVSEKIYLKLERSDLKELKKCTSDDVRDIVLNNVYVSAKFETPTNFNPIWGLPIGSFLKEDSILGQMTAKIWQNEISVKTKERDIKNQVNKINSDKEQIRQMIKDLIK